MRTRTGRLTIKEIKEVPAPGGAKRATAEHYMPDLKISLQGDQDGAGLFRQRQARSHGAFRRRAATHVGEVHHGGERSVVLAGLRESHLGRDAGRRLLHADRRYGSATASANARGARPLGRRLRRQQIRHAVAVPHDRPHGHLPARDPGQGSLGRVAAGLCGQLPQAAAGRSVVQRHHQGAGHLGSRSEEIEPAAGKGKRYAQGPRRSSTSCSATTRRPARTT